MSLKLEPKPSRLRLCGAAAFGCEAGEVEAAEVEGNALLTAGSRASAAARRACTSVGLGRGGIDVVGVEAELVVDLALLLFGEDVVGFGDLFEFFFGLLIPGVHVRVIFAREFAEGLADLILRGRLLDAECAVVVLGLWSCHSVVLKLTLLMRREVRRLQRGVAA